MLKAHGHLVYDPRRDGYKGKTDWWVVVNTGKGITDFYRWLTLKGKGYILNPPSWGAHVTVLRGEEPKYKNMWKKFDGEKIVFEYNPVVRYSGDTKPMRNPDLNGTYWFMEVYSDRLNEIRKGLGLAPLHHFHLTIGRVG